MNNNSMRYLDQWRLRLLTLLFKGSTRRTIENDINRYDKKKRLSQIWRYLDDIVRISNELDIAIKSITNIPSPQYLSKSDILPEDFIMYHQGYFLELVHQLKDKLLRAIRFTVNPEYEDDGKIKRVKVRRIIDSIKDIEGLGPLLEAWDQDNPTKNPIKYALTERTALHHNQNKLPFHDRYMFAKSSRFFFDTEELIATKAVRNFNSSITSYRLDTLNKMKTSYSYVMDNINNISRIIVDHFNYRTNKEELWQVLKSYGYLRKKKSDE